MKRLTLLRHAKSGLDDAVLRDFDRTLNAKGRRAARRIGQYLAAEDFRFDHIAASPATRVRETLAEVAHGYGRPIEPAWDKALYLAMTDTLLDVVQRTFDAAESLLLVGHNPGLEELVLLLVPGGTDDYARGQVEEKYPTASVAEIILDVTEWSAVRPAQGRLARFVRPRDLDPSLGPDA